MAECSGHSKETNAHDQRQKQCNEIKQGTSYISFICFLMITFLYATFIRIDEYIAHHSFLWDRHDSFCFQMPLSYQKHTNLARIPSNKKRLRDPFIHLLNVFIQKKGFKDYLLYRQNIFNRKSNMTDYDIYNHIPISVSTLLFITHKCIFLWSKACFIFIKKHWAREAE